MGEKIRIGISRCLLGDPVRYDGGHSRHHFIVDTLGQYLEYVPVCPEVECGLGVPREAMRLVGEIDNPRLVTIKTGVDYTEKMLNWTAKRLDELEKEDICGFIFKENSPSSGMARVKVYNDSGQPVKKGVGLFAREFMNRFPLVPVEEDGRLNDPKIRENFIEQIFTLKSWRRTSSGKKDLDMLIDFHARHRILILSHSPVHYRAMDKLVASGKAYSIESLFETYESMLLGALRFRTTIKKNCNMLQHMAGYLKKVLSSDEKQELAEVMDQYKREEVPLIVPMTLFRYYARKYNESYLLGQVCLNPHPVSLGLKNHA